MKLLATSPTPMIVRAFDNTLGSAETPCIPEDEQFAAPCMQ